MNIKEVKNVYGELVTIDMDTAKLHEYCNKDKTATYNVQRVKDGEPSIFWTDILIENTTVTNLEEKLRVWNSPILLFYAELVDYHSSETDADEKIWNIVVDTVSKNMDIVFDEYGDLRKDSPEMGNLKRIIKLQVNMMNGMKD